MEVLVATPMSGRSCGKKKMAEPVRSCMARGSASWRCRGGGLAVMRVVAGACWGPAGNVLASLRVAAGPCDAGAMPLHRPVRRLPALLATTLLLAACTAQAPFAQPSGMLLDARLDEISGLAASQAHEGVLWMLDDGGNDPQLFAISTRGVLQATFQVAGVAKTDWEDIAAFELDGRRYLLVADTGDNGGLRRSLQFPMIEAPAHPDRVAQPAPPEPAW